MVRFLRPAVFGLVILAASPVFAQGNEQEAERLFNEATQLVKLKRYAEACPKFEASQRLDPALGTQFNLADCFENTNRPASAWAMFTVVSSLARQAGKTEREQLAKNRAAELEPKLSKIRLVIESPPPGLEIKRDGNVVASQDWSRHIPVDPGEHKFEATAPSAQPWSTTVTIPAGAPTVLDVQVPKLGTGVGDISGPATEEGMGSQRKLALGVGGVGLVGIGIGAVFGIISMGQHDDAAASKCPEGGRCTDQSAVTAWEDARSSGNIATVGFAVGGVFVAAAALLWLTGAPKPTTGSLQVTPFGVRGAF